MTNSSWCIFNEILHKCEECDSAKVYIKKILQHKNIMKVDI